MDSYSKNIEKRYARSTINDKEPHICHHGDCNIFRLGICTCGLLHDLRYDPDRARLLYSQYENEIIQQDIVIDRIVEARNAR